MDYLYNLFSTKEDKLFSTKEDKLLKNIENDNQFNTESTCTYYNLDNRAINRTYYIDEFYEYNLTDNKNYIIELTINSNVTKFYCKHYQKSTDKNNFYLETTKPYNFDIIKDQMFIKIYKDSKILDKFAFKFTINHLVENTDIVCMHSTKHKLFFYFKKKKQYDIFYIDKIIYIKL